VALQQSLGRTWQRRPELLNDLALTEEPANVVSLNTQRQVLQQNEQFNLEMRGYDGVRVNQDIIKKLNKHSLKKNDVLRLACR